MVVRFRFRLREHGLTLLRETWQKSLCHPGREISHPQFGLGPELALATEPRDESMSGWKANNCTASIITMLASLTAAGHVHLVENQMVKEIPF